jgi:L-fuconolactonase
MMTAGRIDAHIHLYDGGRPQGVPWPPAESPLPRTVLVEHWRQQARRYAVEAAVVVEASHWPADNDWLLDQADQHLDILGVIGNLSPHSPLFASELDRLSHRRRWKGVRWRHDLVPMQASDPAVVCAALQLAERNLLLEVNGPSWMTYEVAALAEAVPELRIVIDHAGLPGDPQRLQPDWFGAITAVARHPSVAIKLSGLQEQTDRSSECFGEAPREPSYYQVVLEHCWSCFGAERLMFASNWPASEAGGSYGDALALVESFFQKRGSKAEERYFRTNVQSIYGLNPGRMGS